MAFMKSSIHILYFAALSEALNTREEILALDPRFMTIGQLREYLQARGTAWSALGAKNMCLAANHRIVDADYVLQPGDEIAFFPPVTGG